MSKNKKKLVQTLKQPRIITTAAVEEIKKKDFTAEFISLRINRL
jgi:hypothetical protein